MKNKRFFAVLLAALLLAAILPLQAVLALENPCTLVITVEPAGAGSVTGAGDYEAGTPIDIHALANVDWAFDHWEEVVTTAQGITISEIYSARTTATCNGSAYYEIKAVFQKLVALTVSASPAEGGRVNGGGYYRAGQNVTLKATANDGWRFVEWTAGGNTFDTATLKQAITEDKVYEAKFERITYPLQPTRADDPPSQSDEDPTILTIFTSPDGAGTVTGSGEHTPREAFNISATANQGYAFDHWDYATSDSQEGVTFGNTSAASTTATLKKGNWAIQAVFKELKATLSVERADPASTKYKKDDVVTIEYTLQNTGEVALQDIEFRVPGGILSEEDSLAGGSVLSRLAVYQVTGADSLAGKATITVSATYKNMKGDPLTATLEVPVEKPTYPLVVEASDPTMGTVEGGGSYAPGQTVTLKATVNPGYGFYYWEIFSGDVSLADASSAETQCTLGNDFTGGKVQAVLEEFRVWLRVDREDPASTQYKAGDTVNYSYTVTNDGVDVEVVDVKAQLPDGTIEDVGNIWTGSENYKTFSHSYTVTEADALAGKATITVSVTYWNMKGDPLTATLEVPVENPAYPLTVEASPAEGGTVEGGGSYAAGQTANLKATANPGYAFAGWEIVSGNVSLADASSAETQCAMNSGYAGGKVRAVFKELKATLRVEDENTSSPKYKEGDGVTIKLTLQNTGEVALQDIRFRVPGDDGMPEDSLAGGSVLSKLAVYLVLDTDAQAGKATITVSATYANMKGDPLTATLEVPVEKPTYALTVEAFPAEGGTVEGGGSYAPGQTANLKAAANTGYAFAGWTADSGDVSLADASSAETQCAMNSGYAGGTVVAKFGAFEATLRVERADPASTQYKAGDDVKYSYTVESDGAVAVQDFKVQLPDGTTDTLGSIRGHYWTAFQHSYTVTEADAQAGKATITVSATYKNMNGDPLTATLEVPVMQTYALTVLASPTEGGTVEGNGSYAAGETANLKATAAAGWKFVKWEVSDGAKATLTDDGSAATVCTLGEGWAGGAVTAKFEQTDPTPLPTELYWYDSDGTTELDMTADEALETEGVAETMEYMGEALANKDCHYAFTGFGPLQQRQDTWTEDGEQFTQTVYWRVAQYAPVLIHVEAKPATKTEAGIVEHWHCGECGTNYADAEGKNEIDGVMLPPLTCYQVSVASDPEAGGVVAGEGDYAEGETVTLTATAAEGYRFKAWKVTEGGVTVGADGTFAMPAQDVAATAQWTRKLTAVWLNGDGSELDRKTYWADEARPATDKKATKAQDAQYIYTFDKWDEGTVAGDVTIFAPVFAKKAFYTMEKGNNESYRLKSGKNQVYVLHRSVDDGNALTHLAGVKIGNTQLKLNADFTAVKGSVIITVKPAAMNKLKVGTQPVTISFDDGEVQTQVKILAAYDDQTGTGDNSHMFLWLGLMVMGCAGLLALRTQRKRWTER